MSPVVKRRKTGRAAAPASTRRPLATTNATQCDREQLLDNLVEIFNSSQHVTTSDQALNQLKKLYNSVDFHTFEKPFMDCLRKLLQSKQTIYFKTTCDFICKFLQHLTNLEDDRLVRSCADVADHYMQIASEDCRMNATFFVSKFLSHIESLDEQICNALKITLPKRIRDKKPTIRAQAVLASRKFQDNKLIQEGFLHHFNRDPELNVRKALLQTMDVNIFGLEFLAESTQDSHEAIRKVAFQRLSKIAPGDLTKDQLHQIIHNGLFERERQAAFSFKTNTLDPWLSKMYDGLDLVKLLDFFDIVSYPEDIERLLKFIHERDLDKVENNGTATRLHHVVEAFYERWLSSSNKCLPNISEFNISVVTVWLSLVTYCKQHRAVIKPVKVRSIHVQECDPNESIEKILDSQNQNDEVAELYERLTPDLVNLIDFLKKFVRNTDQKLKENPSRVDQSEFVYNKLMGFISGYEVGDELERKIVQEGLGLILKENLLTGRFMNFIPPLIKAMHKLIYSSSNNLMINYISELIQNIRSHLEDLATPSHLTQIPIGLHSAIKAKAPKLANKRVTINEKLPTRVSLSVKEDERQLEYKIANAKCELEELKDELEKCIKERQFDQARDINTKIENLQADLNLLQGRRYSIASDVSQMDIDFDEEPDKMKLSSTMLTQAEAALDDSHTSIEYKDETKIFKHHTNELIKCLQMYFACLECVRVSEVPPTMCNHLEHLSYESLDEWFKNNARVRSLMIACNGMTALLDKKFAQLDRTITLLMSACYDTSNSLEIKTIGYKSLVDIMIEHNELKVPLDKLENFLVSSMRDYGKYNPKSIKKNELEFVTAIIEGTAKLFYFQKIGSPEVLSHMILWWYHPRTYSKLTQFIGVFLPLLVKDVSRRRKNDEDKWLEGLLSETFVTSIEYLHDYICGPGFNIMAETDMHNLINFLCNLVPISYHPRVHDVVDRHIDDMSSGGSTDLVKYLKQSKNHLIVTMEESIVNQSGRMVSVLEQP